MAVKIRLSRKGKKKKPYYHIVIADARSPRDGKYIEKIGSYNPNINPAVIEIDEERALDWLHKGAQPTETLRAILSYKGLLLKKHLAEGVAKGALSEADAEKKFKTWLADQDKKIDAKKTKLEKVKTDKAKIALAAEKESQEAKAKEERYEKEIAKADNFFDAKDYQNAKSTYQAALVIKSQAQYPKNKINEIKKILATIKAEKDRKTKEETARVSAEAIEKKKKEAAKRAAEARRRAELAKEQEARSALSEEERRKQFFSDLVNKYPEGVTEEVIIEGNKKIIRRIVVYKGSADEYKKIIYPWGVYYKKNGDTDLTEHIFEIETTNWLDK